MLFRRALAPLTALAFAAAGLAVAGPAAAAGEGCAGLPEMPQAYVCVVELNPGAVAPDVTTTPVPVRVPPVCYVAGCTAPTVVNVPVPGASAGSGNVAVLYYQGTYYPIGIGLDVVWPLVQDVLIVAGDAVGTIQGVLDSVPTAGEILRAVHEIVDPTLENVVGGIEALLEEGRDLVSRLPEAIERLRERIAEIIQTISINPPVCIKQIC
jgi:hypothetical protein